ncbi:MAG: transposase [Planctomycetota bacterium]
MSRTPDLTVWHITFGTYGSRLHGDEQPTVDRQHNAPGLKFLRPDPARRCWAQARMLAPPVYLTPDQCLHIEAVLPDLCERGGWDCRVAAAPAEADHVHVLIAAPAHRHGKGVRRWLKVWLGRSLSARFGRPEQSWWAEGGSTKPVYDSRYYHNVYRYIEKQRSMR